MGKVQQQQKSIKLCLNGGGGGHSGPAGGNIFYIKNQNNFLKKWLKCAFLVQSEDM